MNIIIFLGSLRDSSPPKPARLGERVALYCQQSLSLQSHQVTLVDPLDLNFKTTTAGKAFKPYFSYSPNKAPADLRKLADKIDSADAYVMISPEYNHSMSPALADMLNHFGSSSFSYKPSSIVTYSAGQWGGTRAAVGMRSFLAELGCLPVSAMIHIPAAQRVFEPDGEISPNQDVLSWEAYFGRSWAQLQWWGKAAQNHRQLVNPEKVVQSFVASPSQRNAGKENQRK